MRGPHLHIYSLVKVRKDWTAPAHRASWFVFRGPVPAGHLVLHKCAIKGCINPDHLYTGTASDNAKDMWRQGGRQGGFWVKVKGGHWIRIHRRPSEPESLKPENIRAFLNSPPPQWLLDDRRGAP